MAAPTQALPSYLSYSTTVITQPGGSVLTSSTLVELPLTYYGPSIPLGTNGVWTYGGLTSPASTPTPSTATPSSLSLSTTTTPPTSLSPTSTSATTPTSATPSSSVSISVTTLFTTVPPSPSLSPSGTPRTSSSSSLDKGALIGVILGTIFGTLLLLLLLLLCLRWRRKRQNGGYQTPIWTGWEIVDRTPADQDIVNGHGDDRPPGEGSPRGSGEETDPFLRRRRTADSANVSMSDTSTRLVSVPPAAVVAGGVATGTAFAGALTSRSNSGTNNSGGSGAANTESTVVSDYGVLLHGSDYTDDPESSSPTHIPARPSTDMGFIADSRRIVPPSELLRMERERLEQEQLMHNEPSSSRNMATVPEHYSPLSPPPPLDPDRLGLLSTPRPSSSAMSGASGNDQDDPKVLTARRVRLSQLVPRSQPELRVPETSAGASSGGVWGSLGLGGIARLSRLSWFKNFRENIQDQPASPESRRGSRWGSRPVSWVPRPLSEHDIEGSRAFFDDDLKPPRALGFTEEGERPKSSVSAKSASTVYHDAESNPGTPPPLPALPRAYMPASPTTYMEQSREDSARSPMYGSDETAIDDDSAPRLVDVLDMPAPSSVSQFSSASSRSVQFPPGLTALQSPQAWYESSSSEGDHAGITIDVLEDTPPRPGDGWRAIARNATLSHPAEHRTSFGVPQYVLAHDLTAISEVGSLHSMRSHLSPMSPRSSGSAPASSRHNLTGSNSSRPSAYSQGRTGSSGRSLSHSGSISLDERRRTRGAVSPSLSAFGTDGSSMGHLPLLPASSTRLPRPGQRDSTTTARMSYPESAGTEATYTNTIVGYVDDQTTRDSVLLSMPWATGLD